MSKHVEPVAPLPFKAEVEIRDGSPRLTIMLTTDPGPLREFREFLSIELDEMRTLELLGTAAIALRDLQKAAA